MAIDSENRPRAIVTGSSTGIGRAIAIRLAQTGYDLVLHGLSDSDDLASAAAEVEAAGARAVRLAGDVVDPEVPKALVKLANTELGGLDALVNNAGTGLTKPFSEITDEEWRWVDDMHLGAMRASCRAALPLLEENAGSVVNISSLAATLAVPGRVAYGSVKAAIEGFTRNLACELAPQKIRVNAIAPGTIRTPLVQKNFEKGRLNSENVLERTPMGRFGEPAEVASVAKFLLSGEASYMTGQVLHVDGGWSCWGGGGHEHASR